jgi:hypothetical protein
MATDISIISSQFPGGASFQAGDRVRLILRPKCTGIVTDEPCDQPPGKCPFSSCVCVDWDRAGPDGEFRFTDPTDLELVQ